MRSWPSSPNVAMRDASCIGAAWHPLHEFDREAARAMAIRVARHGYAANLVLYARRYVHNFLFTAE